MRHADCTNCPPSGRSLLFIVGKSFILVMVYQTLHGVRWSMTLIKA
jgi:hypothetical protein